MTQEELNIIQNPSYRTIRIDELKNKKPRTLIYGYNQERETIHIYTDGERFFRVQYSVDRFISGQNVEEIRVDDCAPSKRAYPECCDFEFCSLIKDKGKYISFTTINKEREKKDFYGLKIEEIK